MIKLVVRTLSFHREGQRERRREERKERGGRMEGRMEGERMGEGGKNINYNYSLPPF